MYYETIAMINLKLISTCIYYYVLSIPMFYIYGIALYVCLCLCLRFSIKSWILKSILQQYKNSAFLQLLEYLIKMSKVSKSW